MSRRGFLSLSLLAPVAGVMAARDAMAGYAHGGWISGRLVTGQAFVGESVGETLLSPSQVQKLRKAWDEGFKFGVDNIAPAIPARPAEDESVSAQFESDLAFLRDEPGVAI
jgi:hypothetical protein